VTSIVFSANARKLISGSKDCTCKVWDSQTGKLLNTVRLSAEVNSIAYGNDEARHLAFVMGQHSRLGKKSCVQQLDADVLRFIAVDGLV
jgi:WD40 repeat protein